MTILLVEVVEGYKGAESFLGKLDVEGTIFPECISVLSCKTSSKSGKVECLELSCCSSQVAECQIYWINTSLTYHSEHYG